MKAKDVKPEKWLQDPSYLPRVLYDDEEYSVIWGKYEGVPALGARWNVSENTDLGFPNRFGNPGWYVEPDFLATAILQRLLTHAIDTVDMAYYEDIRFAIDELSKKMEPTISK